MCYDDSSYLCHLKPFFRWIAEIDRKQAEMVTTQVAVEKLRQRDQLLTTENEMLKVVVLLLLYSTTDWYIEIYNC